MASVRKQKGRTAAELLAKLNADPTWVAADAERKRVQAERRTAYREAERPVVLALYDVGVPVSSVWDLVNTDESYPKAIPTLLQHLARDYPERVREGIARALAVPETRYAWFDLKDLFERETDQTTLGVKWALALALGASGDDSVLDEVIEILNDSAHGRNRVPFIQVLLRSKEPRAKDVLKALANDATIGKDAAQALKQGTRWIRQGK